LIAGRAIERSCIALSVPVRILNVTDVVDEAGRVRRTLQGRYDQSSLPHGRYSVLEEDGRLFMTITYHHGVPHGPYTDYWSTGGVSLEGQFVNGQQHGTWHFYDKDGSLRELIEFDMGKEVPRSYRRESRKPSGEQ
jgi:antitoxin component YwqK of YwqJK toxin-antitoxin module